MDPYAAAFVRSRSDVIALVDRFNEAHWNEISPLTPQWRVRDVLGHLCGVSEDVVAGNLPSADISAWAAAQVARHRDHSLQAIAATWSSSGVEAMISSLFGQMLFDQISHEFDIRYALGAPGDQESEGVHLAVQFAANSLRGPREVKIVLPNEVIELPGEGPVVTVTCTRFELLRATTGRRSWDQVVALSRDVDSDYLREQLFGNGFFSPTTFDVYES